MTEIRWKNPLEIRKLLFMNSNDPDFPTMTAASFLEAMGGDPPLCLSIIETAVEEATGQVTQISGLSDRSEKEQARAVLHSLRGASGTFGAVSLSALLQTMETLCETEGVQPVLPFLQNFDHEAQRYLDALQCLSDEIRAIA